MGNCRGNILYVGGSGEGNYTSIQDAIDIALKGDTVFVYDDSSPYYERIWINRSIDLVGENKYTTQINGSGEDRTSVVRIQADEVTISGFDIENSGAGPVTRDSGIIFYTENITIVDNFITYNKNGIFVGETGNWATISNNIIVNNNKKGSPFAKGKGIDIRGNYINISNNLISSNGYNIEICNLANGNIHKNEISSSTSHDGIWAQNCNYMIISDNNISGNNGRGIDLYDSDYNYIFNNTIAGNGRGGLNSDGICLRVNSVHNVIQKNVVKNNIRDGIAISREDSMYNIIFQNHIEDNYRRGIEIYDYYEGSVMNNLIYHNNIINNPVNSYDNGIDFWHNYYPIGGNYWDDYNGEDNYKGHDQNIPGSDGLGDTSYNISESSCQDVYPLINKWGENLPYADFIYTGDNLTFTFDASISIDRDGTIIFYEWDFGDGYYGTGKITDHTYISSSNYNVTLTVTDNDEKKHNTTRTVIQFNSPPSTPSKPVGPVMLPPYESSEYYTETSDPNNDMIQYRFDWDANGPHNYSVFSSLVPSGTQVNMTHLWNSLGTYVAKAQACDEHGFASNWSEGLTVVVNNPPDKPSDPEPENGSIDVDIDADLYWSCNDIDGDNLTYDVYFGIRSAPPLVSSDQKETTFDPGTMEFNTTFYWKIIATDENLAVTNGPIWSFTTCSLPNNPPYVPSDPSPENGSFNVTIDVNLSWTGGDPDEGDTVFYDVYLEADNPNPDVKVADDLVETSFNPGMLEYGTVYYWKIVARDNHYAETIGPIWHFTTVENNPPGVPTITGPSSGKPNTEYDFTFNATDPDDDEVKYIINWDDGTTVETVYNPSCVPVEVCHTWNEKDTYIITAKAVDIYGAESDWSEFEISIPRTRVINYSLFQWLFEHFPMVNRLLYFMRGRS